MRYISIIFLVFIIMGCSTHKQVVVVKKKELPSWYQHPKSDNKTTLYSTGEGRDKKEAISDALSMLSSTLSVQVSSKFRSKVVENSGALNSYQRKTISEIKSDVKKIRISGYEVINSQEFSFERYIVLIKCDKKRLFNSLKKELNHKFRMIEKNQEMVADHNIMRQFKACKDAKNSLDGVGDTLIVMSSLDNSFDDSVYVEKMQSIDRDYEKIRSLITFSIRGNSDSDVFKEVIFSGLNAKNLQVIEYIDDSVNHLKIYIKSKTKNTKAYGFFLAKSSIFITVKDYKNTTIGSNKLNITGKSSQSYLLAKENVSERLYKMVEKNSIEKIIGLSY